MAGRHGITNAMEAGHEADFTNNHDPEEVRVTITEVHVEKYDQSAPAGADAEGVEAALTRYSDLGWHLVPMEAGEKKPKITEWQHAASADMDVISGWWSRWPDANLAVAAGRSGLAIVDIDSAEAETLLKQVMGGNALPITPEVRTARGRHLYFADPGGLKPTAALGLDLRVGRSLAILPPSLHPTGVSYHWVRGPWEVDPPGMPAELVQHFMGQGSGSPTGGPITEGARNDTLFREGRRLRWNGLELEEIEEALQQINQTRCDPPLEAGEVARIAASAANGTAGPAERNQLERLLALADQVDLFQTPDRKAFASVELPTGVETWPLGDREFGLWLRGSYYGEHGHAPRSQALAEAIPQLEARALFDGPTREVHVRLAEVDEVIYLDLGGRPRKVVRIGPAGWAVDSTAPVAFHRPNGFQALPMPVHGGSVDELQDFVNVVEASSWRLLVGWLVGALRPQGPYPVLVLSGEQGSAKSTCARLLRALVDPNAAPLRAASRNPHELMISASNSWCVVMDNLSSISPDMSDALCRLATGGGFSTRTLYENDRETILEAQRPVILTGIGDLTRRSDLLDRALIVRLPPIPDEARRTEAELRAAFEQAQPRVLGALLDAVAGALARLGEVRLDRPPRMADFATWVTAAESALEWPDGAFMDAFDIGRRDANAVALESSPIIGVLERFVGQIQVSMTSQELLDALEKLHGDGPKPRGWPANAQGVSTHLQRLAPNLREAGWLVEQVQTSGTDSRKRWHLRRPA